MKKPLLETTESLLVVIEDLPQVYITLGLLSNVYSQESSVSPEFTAQVNQMLAILNQKALDDGINVTVKIKWLPSAYNIELTDQNEYRCDVYLTWIDLYILPTNRIGSDAQVVMMDKVITEKRNISISNISDYVEAMREIKAGGEIKIPGLFTATDGVYEGVRLLSV